MPLGETLKGIFGKKKSLKEVLRENKRTITRAVRDIDREKTNLEKQEKKLIGEIKKNAKAGQMGAVKVRLSTGIILRLEDEAMYRYGNLYCCSSTSRFKQMGSPSLHLRLPIYKGVLLQPEG